MKWKNLLSKVKFVDRFLIIFMTVLLLETIFTIFFCSNVNIESFSKIDLIVRTSISGIFGYFLSANFISISRKSKTQDSNNTQMSSENKLQIFVVSAIGLLCFIIMFIIKIFNMESLVSLAATSQIRDLAVGSIGFLIGYPGEDKS